MQYFKLLTVEEQDEVSRKERVPVHPILDWFDDLGVYHQLILSGADVKWLSRMNVDIKDRNTVLPQSELARTSGPHFAGCLRRIQRVNRISTERSAHRERR